MNPTSTFFFKPSAGALSLLLALFFSSLAQGQQVTTIGRNANINDAMSYSNGVLYGSLYGTRSVTRFDIRTGAATLLGRVNRSANGNVIGPDGQLYVVDDGGQRLFRMPLDRSGAVDLGMIPNPNGVLFIPGTDTLVVASYNDDEVYKRAPDGTIVSIIKDSLLNGPAGLAYGPDGTLYVGNFNDSRVIRAQPDGSQELVGQFAAGSSLGFMKLDSVFLYGTLLSSNRIARMDTRTGNVEIIAGTTANGTVDGVGTAARFDGPNGLVFSPDGDTLFVSDGRTRNIRMITDLFGATSSLTTPILQGSLKVGPNPTNGQTQLSLKLDRTAPVTLRVYDEAGKSYPTFSQTHNRSGLNVQFDLDFSGLPNQVYTVELQSEGQLLTTERVVVVTD